MNRMLLALKRPFIWLYRFRHRCGYGVHSPFAFNLITHVIYETTPYYKYKELASEQKRLMPQKDRAWGVRVLKGETASVPAGKLCTAGYDCGCRHAGCLFLISESCEGRSGLHCCRRPVRTVSGEWRVCRLFYTCTITAVRSLWKRCSVSVPTALRKRPSL